MIASVLIFFAALIAFAFSSRGLVMALTENVVITSLVEGYSRRATRLAKTYKVIAWLTLTIFLFITSAKFFATVFLAL
jgi:predicted membrane-bound dolichyl-phosphate-mannose-protein mannosyltransferase